jgi:disulfide bond formation protein DsbB
MRPDTHLTPGCPWWALSELRLPNVDWCEAQRCAWVVEPANAWSNVAYVAVGAALWWLARDARSRSLRLFGPAAAFVGLCSGIYHSSYTFVLQVLDFAGMYVFCYLLLTLNLQRLGLLAASDLPRRFAQLVVATTALTVAVDFLQVPIQGLVFLLILAIVGTELALRRREPGTRLGFFALAVGLIGTGAVFSVLDVTRTWCDPAHPFLQGHAIWHVLSALSLFAAWLHYRQLDAALA